MDKETLKDLLLKFTPQKNEEGDYLDPVEKFKNLDSSIARKKFTVTKDLYNVIKQHSVWEECGKKNVELFNKKPIIGGGLINKETTFYLLYLHFFLTVIKEHPDTHQYFGFNMVIDKGRKGGFNLNDYIQLSTDLLLDQKLHSDVPNIINRRLTWVLSNSILHIPSMTDKYVTNDKKTLQFLRKEKIGLEKELADTNLSDDDKLNIINSFKKKMIDSVVDFSGDEDSIYQTSRVVNAMNHIGNLKLIQGPIPGFANPKKNHLILSSLDDGIQGNEMSAYKETTVHATYSRSVSTQEGGAAAKNMTASMSNVLISEDDCKTTSYLTYLVREKNIKDILYSYRKVGDKLELITSDNVKSLVGKTIQLRSPLFCKTKHNGVCKKCVGEFVIRLGYINLGAPMATLATTLLMRSMKAFHDMTQKEVELNYEEDGYITPIKDKVVLTTINSVYNNLPKLKK